MNHVKKMSESIVVLREKRDNYLEKLCQVSVVLFRKRFVKLYEEVKGANRVKRFLLKEYQESLCMIKEWDKQALRKEVHVFVDGYPKFDALVAQLFKLYVSISYHLHGGKVNYISIPATGDYVHKAYLAIARRIWKEPFLLYDNVNKLEYSKNMAKLDELICSSLRETFMNMLPLTSFDNDESEDGDDEGDDDESDEDEDEGNEEEDEGNEEEDEGDEEEEDEGDEEEEDEGDEEEGEDEEEEGECEEEEGEDEEDEEEGEGMEGKGCDAEEEREDDEEEGEQCEDFSDDDECCGRNVACDDESSEFEDDEEEDEDENVEEESHEMESKANQILKSDLECNKESSDSEDNASRGRLIESECTDEEKGVTNAENNNDIKIVNVQPRKQSLLEKKKLVKQKLFESRDSFF